MKCKKGKRGVLTLCLRCQLLLVESDGAFVLVPAGCVCGPSNLQQFRWGVRIELEKLENDMLKFNISSYPALMAGAPAGCGGWAFVLAPADCFCGMSHTQRHEWGHNNRTWKN